MRYTRQELKHDKFAETAAEAVHWTVEHRQKLIYAAMAAAVVLALLVGGLWYQSYRAKQASIALGDALNIYNAPIVPAGQADPQITTFPTIQERANAAKKALYEVESKYGSTASGKYAGYLAAVCEQQLGNAKVAEERFKKSVDSGNEDTAALARFALAAVYRDTNRVADAVNIYKQLIDKPASTVPKTVAQMGLADTYLAQQPEEAKKIYQQVMKENPQTATAEIAQAKLASLQ